MINKKSVFCITVKNEEKNLELLFKTIDNIVNLFKEYYIIFVESDSKDDSKKIIQKYIKIKKNSIMITKNFNNNFNRLKKLEISRNIYLDYIKKNKFLRKFDYMFVLDCGNVNNKLTQEMIKKSITKRVWTAIFPTQSIFYYDIWALRIKKLLNHDCFEMFLNQINQNTKLDQKKIFYQNVSKFFFLNNFYASRYIKVNSAFGGLGIYKIKNILKFSYNSKKSTNSEHVVFNEKINKKFGNLFIDKKLINSSGINVHTFNGILCSISNYFVERFLKKIK